MAGARRGGVRGWPRPGRGGWRRSATRSSACFSLGLPNLQADADEREPGTLCEECRSSF